MAKITVDVDTAKKSVEVKLDGKKVNDVANVWINTESGGYFSVEVTQRESVDDSMKKTTRLVASVDDENWREETKEESQARFSEALANYLNQ